MNLKNAVKTLSLHKKKTKTQQLATPWSNAADSEIPVNDYPRPQFRRSDWTCLNGRWQYAFTDTRSRPSRFDGTILVPFSPESVLSGVGRQLKPNEYLWYRRTFPVQAAEPGTRLLLHFQAVDQICCVWVNGKYQGTHYGGYLPFTFDITDDVSPGSNSIILRINDSSDTGWMSRGKQKLHPGGMFYTAQSGIWQTVWLESVPEAYIQDVRITPDLDNSSVCFRFFTAAAADPCPKKVSIYSDGELIYSGETQTDSLTAVLDDVRPWSPEDPFLYDVHFTMGIDEADSYFAMRKISVGRDEQNIPRIFLNNSPYFQNGVLDQGYWPDGLYTAPCDDALIQDILSMKEAGFNMIRKHIKVESLRWYYHCDRLGMLVWQDMVNGGGRTFMPLMCYLPTLIPGITYHLKDSLHPLFSRQDRQGREHWLKECAQTVAHLYNCPCIVMWVPFNEGWGQFNSLGVTDLIRSLDPSRLIDHASGWYDQKGGDVKSVHNYFRNLYVQTEERPFVLSEYGGITCAVPGHMYSSQSYGYQKCQSAEEFKAAYRDIQNRIQALEKEGLCAAVYTQLSDVEEEINGIWTYDRMVNKLKSEEPL